MNLTTGIAHTHTGSLGASAGSTHREFCILQSSIGHCIFISDRSKFSFLFIMKKSHGLSCERRSEVDGKRRGEERLLRRCRALDQMATIAAVTVLYTHSRVYLSFFFCSRRSFSMAISSRTPLVHSLSLYHHDAVCVSHVFFSLVFFFFTTRRHFF